MASTGPDPSTFTVLFVCTGNICRSAFAERLSRAAMQELVGERASTIRIVSAGCRAVVGAPMHTDTAVVLEGYGAEAGDFRARQLDETIAGSADLTLTMTRPHRREVLERAPRALQRTFTLREVADLLASLPERPPGGGPDAMRQLVADLAAVRSRRHSSADDDIRDPIGQTVEVHEEVGELIAASVIPVLQRLAAFAG